MTARHFPYVRPAILALAAACALPLPRLGAQVRSDSHRRGRERVVLSAWKPPGGQRCEISDLPHVLPEPAALVDTADLSVYLQQSGAASQRGYALVSLKFDSAGAARRVRMIESDLPDPLGGAVELAVHTALRPQPAGAPFGVRLRIDFAPEPALRVGRAERCEPARVRGASGYVAAAPPGGAMEERGSARWYHLQWEVRVGPSGHVLDVRLVTPIDDRQLAEYVANHLRSVPWRPGLDDRVPTEMTAVVTDRVKVSVFVRRR